METQAAPAAASSRWRERVATALRIVALLVLAMVPGSRTRPIVIERVAPPVPEEVKDRDAEVHVYVRAQEGGPLRGARVQALAVLDGEVHLAGRAETDAAGEASLTKLPRAEHWIVADSPGRARADTMVALTAGRRDVTLTLEREHTVDVEVKDEQGRPVAGAEIEVNGKDPLPVGARTGAAGDAHVGRLGAGPYLVVARAPGLEEVTQRSVAEGAVARFVLRRLATVVAHVVDAAGAPAGGARVQIAGVTLWPARASDADATGTLRIGALATGSYALRASRGGDVSPTELDVAVSGGDVKDVTLKLEPGVRVAVRALEGEDKDAPPVAGARITLVEGGLSPFPLEAVTDKRGEATLGPILRGPASVSARAEGFVARAAAPLPEPLPPVVEVRLARAGALEGRVTDARGFPVDGATIEVVGTDAYGAPIDDDPRRASFRDVHFAATLAGPAPLVPAGELGVMPGPVPPIPRAGASVVTGPLAQAAANATAIDPAEPWVTRADGTFAATPASPGRVRALVRHPQYVEALSDIVSLLPGATAHVDVVMHAGGALEGRVVDAGGRPVDGARVTVAATRGSLERSSRTASDGSFAFASLPEGVVVSVSTDDDPGVVRARLPLAIPEGGRKEVTITLPAPRPPISLRVDDDRGYPVDAVQLSLTSLDPSVPFRATVFTDARGEARVDGARGVTLRVEAEAPGHAPVAKTIDPDAPLPIAIVLGRAERVTGEVRSTRGDRLKDAEIVVYTELGARRARADADGAFTVDGLAAGAARLRASAPGYATSTRDVTVEASHGDHPTAVGRVELAEEGSVEGVVVDGRDNPVQGARIARDRVPTWLAVGGSPAGVAVSDSRGRFRLGGLAEGTATIEAYAPDVGRGRVDGVRVSPGRATDAGRIVLAATSEEKATEPGASGGVAVTLGVTTADEVVLVAVAEGSAAERAGLAPGDVVLEIDGVKPSTMPEARAKLSGPISDDVVLKVRRADRPLAVRVPREAVRR